MGSETKRLQRRSGVFCQVRDHRSRLEPYAAVVHLFMREMGDSWDRRT